MTKISQTDPYIEQLIRKLEVEGNDMLTMFSETEAGFFPTEDLLEIRTKLQKRKTEFQQLHNRVLFLVALCPAFFILSYLFSLIGWHWLSYGAFGIAPMLFLLFLAGTFYLNRRFGCRGDLDFLLDKANHEIWRRERLEIY